MTGANPTIKTLWIGPRLSELESLSLRSFLHFGHEVELFQYEPVENVPRGVRLRDANEVLPVESIFHYEKKRSVAGFANWFRYSLLFDEGGIWVDTDVVCLRPFDFEQELVFGKEEIGRINNAVLGGPPAHPLFEFMRDQAERPNAFLPFDSWKDKRRKLKRRYLQGNRRGNVRWGEVGPIGLTRAVEHFDLGRFALPYRAFYPIHSKRWDSIFDESPSPCDDLFRTSYALHLWHEMFRDRSGFDKDAAFPESSFIERLKKRYEQ